MTPNFPQLFHLLFFFCWNNIFPRVICNFLFVFFFFEWMNANPFRMNAAVSHCLLNKNKFLFVIFCVSTSLIRQDVIQSLVYIQSFIWKRSNITNHHISFMPLRLLKRFSRGHRQRAPFFLKKKRRPAFWPWTGQIFTLKFGASNIPRSIECKIFQFICRLFGCCCFHGVSHSENFTSY